MADQDEIETEKWMHVLLADEAVRRFNAKEKMSDTLTATLSELLDALDELDEEQGIAPEE